MVVFKRVTDTDYRIYINGELFTDYGYFDEKERIFNIDDFPELDIQKAGDLKTEDFPENFLMKWRDEYLYSPLFNYYSMKRSGKRLIIKALGDLNIEMAVDKSTYDWLLWNPYKLRDELQRLFIDNGLHVEGEDLDDFRVEFNLSANGTIGSIFSKVFADLNIMLREAEINLRDLANKRLEGK